MIDIRTARRWWREQWGSQGIEAAGAALAAALIILALLGVAPRVGAAVQQAFGCAASVLSGGGGASCGGDGAGTAQGTPPGSGAANTAAQNDSQSSPPAEEQNKDDCGAVCQVGGFFKGFGEGAVDTAKGIWTLGKDAVGLATGDEETHAKYAQLADAFRQDAPGTLWAMGKAMVEPIVEDWKAGRYGEAIGRGTFEAVSTIVADKGLSKLGKLGKVEKVVGEGLAHGDEAGDAARGLRAIPCLGALPVKHKAPGLAAPLRDCFLRKIASTRGLEHSFDNHAAQWFGRQVSKETHLSEWQALIERASQSKQVLNWRTGADATVAHLARIDGKYFVVQFFKEGDRAGELATAFVPNQGQVAAMLRLLGHSP